MRLRFLKLTKNSVRSYKLNNKVILMSLNMIHIYKEKYRLYTKSALLYNSMIKLNSTQLFLKSQNIRS